MGAITTIPASYSFVDVLARGVLTAHGDDPLTLSQAKILLPSRRACRQLKEALIAQAEHDRLILPNIMALGDDDEAKLPWLVTSETTRNPPVSPLKRWLMLSEIIQRYPWKKHLSMLANEQQAGAIAHSIAQLIDELQREHISHEKLRHAAPDELAEHWQATGELLYDIIEKWREARDAAGYSDPVDYRNHVMEQQALALVKNPPDTPIYMAGTTGSMPSTRALLGAVHRLEQGMVILPGLDKTLDEASWQALEPHHPQYGLKQLLAHLDVSRSDVGFYGEAAEQAVDALWSSVMLPAARTEAWEASVQQGEQAIELVESATIHEEAQVIALMLRDAIEQQQTASLVTNHRPLAQRVAVLMGRWGVSVDDSAGVAMAELPVVQFLQHITSMIISRAAPVELLTLLKHPLCRMGYSVQDYKEIIALLEMYVLRGVRHYSSLEGVLTSVNYADISDNNKEKLLLFINKIKDIADVLGNESDATMDAWMKQHLLCAEQLAQTDEQSGAERLWLGEQGEQVARYAADVMEAATQLSISRLSYYHDLQAQCWQRGVYRPRYGTHPSVHILSPIEARLHHSDVMILADLNEGSWPAEQQPAWLNRAMRQSLGLPELERMTGLSAHDFVSFASAKRVILSRARKDDAGSPAQPARWLERLKAVAEISDILLTMSKPWVVWAQQLNNIETYEFEQPPAPCPPAKARPKRYSVSDVDLLLSNPYGYYAKHILKLLPLDPIDEDPQRRDFGTALHAILEAFIPQFDADAEDVKLLELWLTIAEEKLKPFTAARPALRAVWWPQAEAIGQRIVTHERARRVNGDIDRTIAEEKLEAQWGELTMVAKVDRVDMKRDGVIELIDYKTGQAPSGKAVKEGRAIQLPLSAAIVKDVKGLDVSDMAYWEVKASAKVKEVRVADALALRDEIAPKLKTRIEASLLPEVPYLSCPHAELRPAYDDYEQLARRKAWQEN